MVYRRVVDTLVDQCRGAVGPARVRAGVWNENATAAAVAEDPSWREQHEINVLLARLSDHDREVLAGMLQSSFEGGIHDTLVTLHDAEVEPFDSGYEGSPFHDFVGRLTGWQWPEGDPGP